MLRVHKVQKEQIETCDLNNVFSKVHMSKLDISFQCNRLLLQIKVNVKNLSNLFYTPKKKLHFYF